MPDYTTGLVLSLAADVGVLDASDVPCTDGVAVKTWQDQSGSANHATQATSGNRPVFLNLGINGKPSIRCTAASTQKLIVTANFAPPCTILVVGRIWSLTNSARLLSGKINNWLLGWWNGAMDQAYFDGVVKLDGTPAATTSARLYSATLTGSLSTIHANGVQIASNGGGLSGPNGIFIGGDTGAGPGTEFSDCDVSAVRVYDSAISDGNRQSAEGFLLDKYFVTPAVRGGGSFTAF